MTINRAMMSDLLIRLADEADARIQHLMKLQSTSSAPCIKEAMGEINMAFHLKLMDYQRHQLLLTQLRNIVNQRRSELTRLHQNRVVRAAP